MAIPMVSWFQFIAQALPIAASAAVRDRQSSVPYRRVAVWCAILVLADVVDRWSSMNRGQNLDISYGTLPLEVAGTLWIAAAWQLSATTRRLYSALIPVVLCSTLPLLLVDDPMRVFSTVITPVLALLALGSVIQTLVHRALDSRRELQYQGWFWVCLGMAVFWTGFVSVPMFADLFLETHRNWVITAYLARGWVNIGAFLLITWGVLCPRFRPQSSGSS